VTVYLMEVTKADDEWQESGLRERIWVSGENVVSRLQREEIIAIFRVAVEWCSASFQGGMPPVRPDR
jgi:hypothetical protein